MEKETNQGTFTAARQMLIDKLAEGDMFAVFMLEKPLSEALRHVKAGNINEALKLAPYLDVLMRNIKEGTL